MFTASLPIVQAENAELTEWATRLFFHFLIVGSNMIFAAMEMTELTLLLIALAGLFLLSSFAGGNTPNYAGRMRIMERKLDLILEQSGIDPNQFNELSKEVRSLADAGQKIGAIKEYRSQTGAGLREAKEAVEAYLNGQA